MNRPNMSFGINYKFSGLLHHNLERLWVVTKIAIPKLEDIHFPDIDFDPDCKFTRKLNNARQAAKYEIQSICKSMKALISLLTQKERHYENAIKALLKEEIPRSLHESGHSQSSRSNQLPVSAGQRFLCDTREGEMPVSVCKKRAVPALVPALASLVMIAVESLNSFLQKKQSEAMATGLSALRHDQTLAWNLLWQLEHDFLIYGKYNVEKLQDIVMTVNIERLLTGQDLQMLQVAHMVPDVIGRKTFIHKLNLYVHSMLQRQIRLYEWLLRHLQDLLDSIGILSTGHLPPELFPPTVLQNVTANAIEMVHKTHPDYVLAIRHTTEYYDMKLAVFGLDSDGSMVVAFAVFCKSHASEPKTLYEIEMVKVPIPDKNKEADSYSEVKYSKPYLAINEDYYIQLRIQELHMCKWIRHTCYCEELFLLKYMTKHSCESAIFYNLTADVVYSVCQFDYFYNTTVPPSILDGGSNILLANMLSPKTLICMADSPMARPLPSHPYVLVNRSILCNCHLQTGLNYLLKSLSSCDSGAPFTMYFTVNSAIHHFMSEFSLSDSLSPNGKLLSWEYIFDICLNDTSKPSIHPNTSWPILPLDSPNTLLELFQSISSRPHTSPNLPFFPIVQHTSMKIPNYPRKGSFLFSTAAHIAYFCTACILTCMLAPQIYLACKHKKLCTLVTR